MPKRMPTAKLLNEAMLQVLPQFTRMGDQKRNYWFCNPASRERMFHQIVIFTHSGKYTCFGVDAYTGVFPTWDQQYGTHLLSRATGLPNIRLKSSAIPMTESWYSYDGTEEGARVVLGRIVRELCEYCLPWFVEAETVAQDNILVQHGFRWLDLHWDDIPEDVGDRMTEAFCIADHKPCRVQFPLLNDLKTELRQVGSDPRVTKLERQEISVLAIHLLRYAQCKKRDVK